MGRPTKLRRSPESVLASNEHRFLVSVPLPATPTEEGTQMRKAMRGDTPALGDNSIEDRKRRCGDGEKDVDSCPIN